MSRRRIRRLVLDSEQWLENQEGTPGIYDDGTKLVDDLIKALKILLGDAK
jgi:hypothetical protein